MEQEPRFRVGDFTRKGIKSNFCPLASARGSGMRHDELLECRRRGLAWFTVTSRTSQFSHLTRGGMTDCLGQDSSASSSRALPPSLIHSTHSLIHSLKKNHTPSPLRLPQPRVRLHIPAEVQLRCVHACTLKTGKAKPSNNSHKSPLPHCA